MHERPRTHIDSHSNLQSTDNQTSTQPNRFPFRSEVSDKAWPFYELMNIASARWLG
jgi:hypothetical protein